MRLEGGKLNLRGFINLKKINFVGSRLKTPLLSLDVSDCKKLTDLYVFDQPLLESEIIGLEKTSIIRLDCRRGDLLRNHDPQFI